MLLVKKEYHDYGRAQAYINLEKGDGENRERNKKKSPYFSAKYLPANYQLFEEEKMKQQVRRAELGPECGNCCMH